MPEYPKGGWVVAVPLVFPVISRPTFYFCCVRTEQDFAQLALEGVIAGHRGVVQDCHLRDGGTRFCPAGPRGCHRGAQWRRAGLPFVRRRRRIRCIAQLRPLTGLQNELTTDFHSNSELKSGHSLALRIIKGKYMMMTMIIYNKDKVQCHGYYSKKKLI